jgi:hypothetical protein
LALQANEGNAAHKTLTTSHLNRRRSEIPKKDRLVE